ncbi:MAG: Hpt domain-containing protein [Alphaproteobacteria bacterium]
MSEYNAEIPINLELLNSYTDGDKDISKTLIEVFIESADEDIEKLKTSLNSGGISWKEAAHSFKGASYTLGAEKLGSLLKEAELSKEACIAEREKLFNLIFLEYNNVKKYAQEIFY